jgi:hypothetical protein
MCGGVLREVEFDHDVPDVTFDGAFADDQTLGDARVGEALGHQGEHGAFPLGQGYKRVVPSARGEQGGDDIGIERGSSVGDALGGRQEFSYVEDAVLE